MKEIIDRAPGCYSVKVQAGSPWVAGQWTGEHWHVYGFNAMFDVALADIGDRLFPGKAALFRWFHPSRWRHRKRRTSYNVLTATAGAQCATGPINEGDHCTVYQGDDDNWHVRKTAEFQDGRFERTDLTEGWPSGPGEKADG